MGEIEKAIKTIWSSEGVCAAGARGGESKGYGEWKQDGR